MTEKDIAAIIEAEGKRLEAIHKEYMERHQDFMKRYQEFMDLVKQIEREYKKRPCQTDTLTGASNPTN